MSNRAVQKRARCPAVALPASTRVRTATPNSTAPATVVPTENSSATVGPAVRTSNDFRRAPSPAARTEIDDGPEGFAQRSERQARTTDRIPRQAKAPALLGLGLARPE